MTKIAIKYIDTREVVCNIDYDVDTDSPRDWDNLGTMILFHTKYNMPNETDLSTDDFDGWQEMSDYLTKEHDAYIILPVQMYDHSGISIYVGDSHDQWDGGQLGFIFCTAEQIKKWYEVKRITKDIRERAEQGLRGEVDTYSKYVSGEVYSFNTEDMAGNIIDGCSGYFDVEDIKSEHSEFNNITYKLEGSVL